MIQDREFKEIFPEPIFSFDTAGIYQLQLITRSVDNCRDTTLFNFVVIDAITDIETNIEDKITLFPNPARRLLQISASPRFYSNRFSVFDVMGNKVGTLTLNPSGEGRLDLMDFRPGLYLIRSDQLKHHRALKFVVDE